MGSLFFLISSEYVSKIRAALLIDFLHLWSLTLCNSFVPSLHSCRHTLHAFKAACRFTNALQQVLILSYSSWRVILSHTYFTFGSWAKMYYPQWDERQTCFLLAAFAFSWTVFVSVFVQPGYTTSPPGGLHHRESFNKGRHTDKSEWTQKSKLCQI